MVKLAEDLNEKSIATVHRMGRASIPEEVRENVEDVLISLQRVEDRLLDLSGMLRERQEKQLGVEDRLYDPCGKLIVK